MSGISPDIEDSVDRILHLNEHFIPPVDILHADMLSLQESSVPTELLTSKSTMSNKLLSLANPRTRRTCIPEKVRVEIPWIGTMWYLPFSWFCYIYLAYVCISEMSIYKHIPLTSGAQVLIAMSGAALLMFTVLALLKVECHPMASATECKLLKQPKRNCLFGTVRSHKYLLQALSAYFMINSYLLLRLTFIQSTGNPVDGDTDNGFVDTERNISVGNTSETNTWISLPFLQSENRLTYLEFCVNFAIPLVFHSVQESDPIWQKGKLWGLFYSMFLILSAVKYLSTSFNFFAVGLAVYQSPQNLLFQGPSAWLPALYIASVLSVFLCTLALKIYVDTVFRIPSSCASASNLSLRRTVRSYPSPLGVVLATFLLVGCETPILMHLMNFVLRDTTEQYILYLLTFSFGYWGFCACAALIIALRRRCYHNKNKSKHKRVDSGVCLANSFVYQSSPTAGTTRA